MGLHEKTGVLGTLGVGDKLFSQLASSPEFSPYQEKHPHSHEYREELRSLSQLLTQFPRASIHSSYLRGRVPSGSDQRRAKGSLNEQFSLVAFRACGKRGEEFQGGSEVTDCLKVG
jgi:hypothetical protein